MNNQEAIANLNMIRVGFVDPATKEQMKLIYDTFDNAIKALEQEPCEDAISRQAVLETLDDMDNALDEDRTVENYKELLKECYEVLPSVNPQPKTGHCKDCKWWKDSDGTFRRGIGAESRCPINREEVYEGNGYCFLFEPQESEEV